MIVYKLKMEGRSCVFHDLYQVADEVLAILRDGQRELTVHVIEMTEEEYEALPEFEGW